MIFVSLQNSETLLAGESDHVGLVRTGWGSAWGEEGVVRASLDLRLSLRTAGSPSDPKEQRVCRAVLDTSGGTVCHAAFGVDRKLTCELIDTAT